MSKVKQEVIFIFRTIRFILHIIVLNLHSKNDFLIQEKNQWIKIIRNSNDFGVRNFIWLLHYVPEYRSVFYFRIGRVLSLIRILAPGRESLYINMNSAKVGKGLVIQHGFSTIVEAHSIGENCQIWHNVTVGTNISHSGNKAIIGNNVKISAGAIVIGNITIGDNVTIGAGSVVVKDIPANCIVVGNPAIIVKQDGKKVKVPL